MNQPSSFVNSAEIQRNWEEAKRKKEEQEKGTPTVDVPGHSQDQTAAVEESEIKLPDPLTKEEAEELVSSIERGQYFKDYSLFGGKVYTLRLWTSKEESQFRSERAKLKAKLNAQTKNEIINAYTGEAARMSSVFSEPISGELQVMIDDAMTSFENLFLLSRCIVKIDGKVVIPEECSTMIESMPSEQVSLLATILSEHRKRYSDLAYRSIEDVNIKKSLASRQFSMSTQG